MAHDYIPAPTREQDDQKLKVTCDYRIKLFGLGYMIIYLFKKSKEKGKHQLKIIYLRKGQILLIIKQNTVSCKYGPTLLNRARGEQLKMWAWKNNL